MIVDDTARTIRHLRSPICGNCRTQPVHACPSAESAFDRDQILSDASFPRDGSLRILVLLCARQIVHDAHLHDMIGSVDPQMRNGVCLQVARASHEHDRGRTVLRDVLRLKRSASARDWQA